MCLLGTVRQVAGCAVGVDSSRIVMAAALAEASAAASVRRFSNEEQRGGG